MNWLNKYKNLISIIVLAVVALLLLSRLSDLTVESLLEFEPPTVFHGLVVFALIYAIKGVLIFPPMLVLYISAGSVFHTFWGILVSYIGLFVTLTVSYIFGKRMGEERIWRLISKNKKIARFLDDKEGDNYIYMCFLARVLPVPCEFFSMFCGAVKMSFLKYIAASLLGLSPFMLPIVIAGAAIANPLSVEFLVPFGFSIAISVLSFYAYKRKVK